jgi:translation initiation factor 1
MYILFLLFLGENYMSKYKVVWDDKLGDLRKAKTPNSEASKASEAPVLDPKNILLHVRRLKSGKGRTVIEISNLPQQEAWRLGLAQKIKKSLGVGGTYKNNYIEIHVETLELVTALLDKQSLKWKKIGG